MMEMQKKTEIQTAFNGVPVMGLIFVHTLENGRRRSREKAKTVRPSACMAVKQTNLMMIKPATVKKMPPAFPRLL